MSAPTRQKPKPGPRKTDLEKLPADIQALIRRLRREAQSLRERTRTAEVERDLLARLLEESKR